MVAGELGLEFISSPNICAALVTVFDNMNQVLGGSNRTLAVLYMFFFVIPFIISLGVGENTLFALLGGLVGHTALLLLLNSRCLTMNIHYLTFNWVFEILLVGLFIIVIFKKDGFG